MKITNETVSSLTEAPENNSHLMEKIAALEAQITQMTHDHKNQLTTQNQDLTQKLSFEKLKIQAVKEGIIDPDGLKLLNPEAFIYDEKGNIKNSEALITQLKTEKKYLFQGYQIGSGASLPPHAEAKAPDVRSMTEEEARSYARARGLMLPF